ncbi:rho-related BTB domain-containing protein 1 isoform X2 [Ischnura elegans]|uniref:rho-related BTB domain-containing protein 1 isoform X2 n=1 Tax=Ischnura elegans TaxID=197161 RepID=UPI001ED8B93C|nr:rho-related BTB domain-containing protein 1 isoform X2 [Ischnura elegans]
MKLKKRELVKCVVVGDTAVGKTRLICARACNKHVSLSQLLTTHVPTVWAIDQYRIYKDVLERSWEVVDGVNVSLRLWDTFGDHEKDRRFAYGRSDVVLLCFSITNPVSLRNCKVMWYPEIRRFCPQTPVLLVGCKNDQRYMYRDEAYLSFFRDKSPFVRPTRKTDLVMPDQARAIAKELGVYYYETSVFTYYGVNEVFENAIRAALMARRQQRFWMTNLKKVQRPLLQAPFRPPKPPPAEVWVGASTYDDNMVSLHTNQAHTDVIFVAGSVGFSAHRFLLAAASPALLRLLLTDLTIPSGGDMGARSSSETSMVSTFGESTIGDFNEDTEYLIRVDNYKPTRVWDQIKRRSSCQVLPSDARRVGVSRELNHPAFQSIRIEEVIFHAYQCEGLDHKGRPTSSVQTVITLSKLVTPQAMQQCLQFLYTGTIDSRFCDLQTVPLGLLLEIRQAAEFLDLPELLVFVSNIQAHEEFINTDLKQQFKKAVRNRLHELCLGQGLFSDVVFQLEDGSLLAHRALLMARCDMMRAMFSGDFRESSSKVIHFPGVKQDTFRRLLTYLYTDEIPAFPPSSTPQHCLDLLELANRLCLPRLVHLVERNVVNQMEARIAASNASNPGNGGDTPLEMPGNTDVVEDCLCLVEPCKLHNADQLADWCMSYLCSNYNKICKTSPKLLKSLHPDNQAYLSEHRWPPVWYLKDYDYYQKCALEREKEEKPLKSLKRSRNNSGCLCFTGKSRRSGGERPPSLFVPGGPGSVGGGSMRGGAVVAGNGNGSMALSVPIIGGAEMAEGGV